MPLSPAPNQDSTRSDNTYRVRDGVLDISLPLLPDLAIAAVSGLARAAGAVVRALLNLTP